MIHVECKPDAALVRSVASVHKREIYHQKGKGEVCNRLEGETNSKGLVDEDPSATQPAYLKKLAPSQDLSHQGLRELHDRSRGNSLVVLCPTLEEWILKAAEEARIDVRQYHLPDDPVKLHRVINLELDNFEKLVEDLKDSRRLRTLRRLLEAPNPQMP